MANKTLLILDHLLGLRVLLQSDMLVDPVQNNFMPNEPILGLQHPMVLIWERQELALYSFTLQHVECRQTLTDR